MSAVVVVTEVAEEVTVVCEPVVVLTEVADEVIVVCEPVVVLTSVVEVGAVAPVVH